MFSIGNNFIHCIEFYHDDILCGELHYIKDKHSQVLRITSVYTNPSMNGYLTNIFPILITYFKSNNINTITLVSSHSLWTKLGFTQDKTGTWELKI